MPTTSKRASRSLALILAGSLITPTLAFGAAGCGNNSGGGGGSTAPANTQPIASNNAPMNGGTQPMTGTGAQTMAGSGTMASTTQQRPGMSTKEKVVLLAGAALLYYLYKKHQAAEQAQTAGGQTAMANGGSGQGNAQLYRSSNGGIYYRNAQHQAVWVTAPSGSVSVPASQVQQYAPDYQQYSNQATPAPPAGAQTQSATQYDPSLSTAS